MEANQWPTPIHAEVSFKPQSLQELLWLAHTHALPKGDQSHPVHHRDLPSPLRIIMSI